MIIDHECNGIMFNHIGFQGYQKNVSFVPHLVRIQIYVKNLLCFSAIERIKSIITPMFDFIYV